MTWREIAVDQNLRLTAMLLEQQGQIKALTDAADSRRHQILLLLTAHAGCLRTCDLGIEIREVLGVTDDE